MEVWAWIELEEVPGEGGGGEGREGRKVRRKGGEGEGREGRRKGGGGEGRDGRRRGEESRGGIGGGKNERVREKSGLHLLCRGVPSPSHHILHYFNVSTLRRLMQRSGGGVSHVGDHAPKLDTPTH